MTPPGARPKGCDPLSAEDSSSNGLAVPNLSARSFSRKLIDTLESPEFAAEIQERILPAASLLKEHPRRTQSLRRYKVVNTGYDTPCFLWTGPIGTGGYGSMKRDHRLAPAHRVYYVSRFGPVPEGKELDHLCRIRHCVNPEHLEPVTRAENIRRGALAKLTLEDVQEIKRLYATGRYKQMTLARIYGVGQTTISAIVCNMTWREVG